MILPAYNFGAQRWDDYRHFHVPAIYRHKPIVQFATGELMITSSKPDPDVRRVWPEYNIALTSTDDGLFKFALPDGTPVPKAWITQNGGQYLLVDLDTKRAVKLTNYQSRRLDMPTHMRTMSAGFLCAGGEPIGGQIEVKAPYKLTPADAEWQNTVMALCGAHCEFNGLTQYRDAQRTKLSAHVRNMDPQKLMLLYSDYQKQHIAGAGYLFPREIQRFDYLTIL